MSVDNYVHAAVWLQRSVGTWSSSGDCWAKCPVQEPRDISHRHSVVPSPRTPTQCSNHSLSHSRTSETHTHIHTHTPLFLHTCSFAFGFTQSTSVSSTDADCWSKTFARFDTMSIV